MSVRPLFAVACDLHRSRSCERLRATGAATVTDARAEATAAGWVHRRARPGDPHSLGDGRRSVDVCPPCARIG